MLVPLKDANKTENQRTRYHRNTPRFLNYALPTRPYLIPIRLHCFHREIISNFVSSINKNSVNIRIHALHTDKLPSWQHSDMISYHGYSQQTYSPITWFCFLKNIRVYGSVGAVSTMRLVDHIINVNNFVFLLLCLASLSQIRVFRIVRVIIIIGIIRVK